MPGILSQAHVPFLPVVAAFVKKIGVQDAVSSRDAGVRHAGRQDWPRSFLVARAMRFASLTTSYAGFASKH